MRAPVCQERAGCGKGLDEKPRAAWRDIKPHAQNLASGPESEHAEKRGGPPDAKAALRWRQAEDARNSTMRPSSRLVAIVSKLVGEGPLLFPFRRMRYHRCGISANVEKGACVADAATIAGTTCADSPSTLINLAGGGRLN